MQGTTTKWTKTNIILQRNHAGWYPQKPREQKQSRRKPTQTSLTSTSEGPVVARRVATLAVQGGGDRGGGGRGDIVLRGAGGQMVVPMSIFEGWHRHVGSVIGILVCGEIDGGMRLLSCSDRRKLVVSHRIKKLTRRRPDERESNARLRVSFERNLDPF